MKSLCSKIYVFHILLRYGEVVSLSVTLIIMPQAHIRGSRCNHPPRSGHRSTCLFPPK